MIRLAVYVIRPALIVAVAFACFGVLSNYWVLKQAGPRIAHSAEGVHFRSTAIVPGAQVWKDHASATLADRLHCALELYESGKVKQVLVSGDHGRRDYNEVHAMKKWLLQRGVKESHIQVDHAGFRTLDTMQRARNVFRIRAATICTQGFHLPRAVFLASRAGIDAAGVISDRRVYAAERKNTWRERIARIAAVVDTYLLDREPRFPS